MLFHCPCLPSPPSDRSIFFLSNLHPYFFSKSTFLVLPPFPSVGRFLEGEVRFIAHARLALVGIYFRFLVRALYGLLAGLEGSNRKKSNRRKVNALIVYIYPSSVFRLHMSIYHPYRTLYAFVFLVFYFICRAPMPSRAALVRSCLLIPMVHQFDPRSTSPFFFVSFSTVPPVGRWLFSLSFSFFDPSSFTFTFDFVSSISRLSESLSALIDCLLCTVLSTYSSVRPSVRPSVR